MPPGHALAGRIPNNSRKGWLLRPGRTPGPEEGTDAGKRFILRLPAIQGRLEDVGSAARSWVPRERASLYHASQALVSKLCFYSLCSERVGADPRTYWSMTGLSPT